MYICRLHPRLCLIVTLCTAVLRAEGDAGIENIPPELKVPGALKLLHTADAKGVQIYKAHRENGKLVWKLEAPRADLTVVDDKGIWKHYAGPTWEAADGSRIKKADTSDAVKSIAAPNANEDIPWLLIMVRADGDKAGVLSGVTAVQRIRTKGGKTPATAPVALDDEKEVPYTATYIFYGKAR